MQRDVRAHRRPPPRQDLAQRGRATEVTRRDGRPHPGPRPRGLEEGVVLEDALPGLLRQGAGGGAHGPAHLVRHALQRRLQVRVEVVLPHRRRWPHAPRPRRRRPGAARRQGPPLLRLRRGVPGALRPPAPAPRVLRRRSGRGPRGLVRLRRRLGEQRPGNLRTARRHGAWCARVLPLRPHPGDERRRRLRHRDPAGLEEVVGDPHLRHAHEARGEHTHKGDLDVGGQRHEGEGDAGDPVQHGGKRADEPVHGEQRQEDAEEPDAQLPEVFLQYQAVGIPVLAHGEVARAAIHAIEVRHEGVQEQVLDDGPDGCEQHHPHPPRVAVGHVALPEDVDAEDVEPGCADELLRRIHEEVVPPALCPLAALLIRQGNRAEQQH
mmetsp:Transcript_82901/g.230668  ORF Transcript_82901/g.230668 Transcript_82901/m.230668 type:complete len:379 (-) Transcript_82901:111-1247(-)